MTSPHALVNVVVINIDAIVTPIANAISVVRQAYRIFMFLIYPRYILISTVNTIFLHYVSLVSLWLRKRQLETLLIFSVTLSNGFLK
jgi:hypothetical protein